MSKDSLSHISHTLNTYLAMFVPTPKKMKIELAKECIGGKDGKDLFSTIGVNVRRVFAFLHTVDDIQSVGLICKEFVHHAKENMKIRYRIVCDLEKYNYGEALHRLGKYYKKYGIDTNYVSTSKKEDYLLARVVFFIRQMENNRSWKMWISDRYVCGSLSFCEHFFNVLLCGTGIEDCDVYSTSYLVVGGKSHKLWVKHHAHCLNALNEVRCGRKLARDAE
jgi:tRNA threonylcarbamoyladenosine modification (KEOPS) complex Cgi121 subunit